MVESVMNTLYSTDSHFFGLVFMIAMFMCNALIPLWPLIVLYGEFMSFFSIYSLLPTCLPTLP